MYKLYYSLIILLFFYGLYKINSVYANVSYIVYVFNSVYIYIILHDYYMYHYIYKFIVFHYCNIIVVWCVMNDERRVDLDSKTISEKV